jgi:hypothetical protein
MCNKIFLNNRGQNKVWEIDSPATTAAAFKEMLRLNEDDNRQLHQHLWLIDKIEKIEPGGLYDTWFSLAQALVMMLNMRTYAEIIVIKEGAVVYRTHSTFLNF